MTPRGAAATAAVTAAVASVSDPEFPGVTIDELGILESVRAESDRIIVELVPTFLGCPAMATIESDVRNAAEAAAGPTPVEVIFLTDPGWTVQRISPAGARKLAEEFAVAVPRATALACPICGSGRVEPRAAFGPTACRSIAYCPDCMNPLEVMKT